MNVRSLVAVVASLVVGTTTHAQAVQYQNGSTFTTAGISGFQTTGSMMSGLRVTANFSEGSTFTGTWGDIGTTFFRAGYFGLVDDNWGSVSLGASENTDGSYWWLKVYRSAPGTLTSLTFNGGAAGVVFDCRFTAAGCDHVSGTEIDGTPASSYAIPFQVF
jgi:hypothetical protein